MTTTREIRDLIAEQAATPAERKALEGVAERLDDALSQDVPYRPAFRAELRRKLMAQARLQAPLAWYRRPVVWGSAMGVAAAAGILAVGLSLWNDTPRNPATEQPPISGPVTPGPGPETDPHLVSTFPDLPRLQLPDEQLPAGHPGAESLAGLDWSGGLRVYKLSGRPDLPQFTKIATGLKFTAPAETLAGEWAVTQGARSLRMGFDGHVTYADTTPEPSTALSVDAAGATAAARQFLLDASLPFAGEPLVMEASVGAGARRLYRVTYTPRVDGRPVVNTLAAVTVSDRGIVVQADAYVRFVEESGTRAAAISPDEARVQAQAQSRGSALTPVGLDLVYVRTQSTGGDWYLQPYWRVFGTGVVRYVPALK